MNAGSCAALLPLLLLTASFSEAQGTLPKPAPRVSPGPAALSVPDPFAGLRPGDHDLYHSHDRSDRFRRLGHPRPLMPVVFFSGVYLTGPHYQPYPSHQPPLSRARGGLTLETLPGIAQVYLDGFFVGLVEDFGQRGRVLDLPAGAHRVELRAPGYETFGFSVLIAPNEIVRFRGDMHTLSTKQTDVIVPPQPRASKNLYVIRNCYAGDRPPTVALPPGCDPKDLQSR